jgi:hypothetical protein
VIARLFAGAQTSGGTTIYNSFPYDAGLNTANWALWKFSAPLTLDSGSVGFVFTVPPAADPATFNGPTFTLTQSVDTL